MKRSVTNISVALVLGLGLTLALLWLMSGSPAPVTAAPAQSPGRRPLSDATPTHYVAITGTDTGTGLTACSTPVSACRTIQYALGVAGFGDEILVATGVYTPNGQNQVVYITKGIAAIRGGYTTTNGFAGPPDPIANPTILDGQGQARGVSINAAVAITLEGLHVTNGAASGDGGGIYGNPDHKVVVISGCHIYSNTASGDGGGICLRWADNSQLVANEIYSNTATSGSGGGVHFTDSPGVSLSGNRISNNEASLGGGVSLAGSSDASLTDNEVFSNTGASQCGGIRVNDSDRVTLMRNRVYSNTSNSGGGVWVGGTSGSGDSTLQDNDIYANRATAGGGGGVRLWNSPNVTLAGNDIYSNTASTGGGIEVYYSPTATLTGNEIYSNTAVTHGGGVYAAYSPGVSLADNSIHDNRGASHGGGVAFINSDDATVTGNEIYSNTATSEGGGIRLRGDDGVTVVNNTVAQNRLAGSGEGAGIHINDCQVHLLHTTIARNSGGDGSGIYVTDHWDSGYQTSTVYMTNTILVSHTAGISVTERNVARLEATLWGDGAWGNGEDWGGDGDIFTGTLNVTGLPAFLNPDGGDYHITFGSAAWEAGVDAGVEEDIDGDSRLFGAPPDLGADEFLCYVCRNDDTGTLYPTVQAALDGSSTGDVVKVAGTCRGVETRGSTQQAAYVTETLTIRGGYSADFSQWDPQTYPTTLDAQRQGRVIYAAGDYTPTLERLWLVKGLAATSGGGVFASGAHPIISGCHVYSNAAGNSGGGMYLDDGHNARLMSSLFLSNTAMSGGGIFVRDSPNVLVMGTEIRGNTGKYGGGIALRESDATLINNVLADNQAGSWAGGLYVWGASPRLIHNTIARNAGGDGSGIYVTDRNGVYRTVLLTNTVLVSHTIGITVTAGNTATLEATLWGERAWGNDLDWGGGGYVTGTNNYTGTPAFVDPDGGDYHIGEGSAALDRGVDAGVSTDIDGDARLGLPDLGADEAWRRIYLPLVLRNYP